MAKKTPVKKSKRGLKRSVRRSLAAVFMVTAIGVAAIPVPENYAEEIPSVDPGTSGSTSTDPHELYTYVTTSVSGNDVSTNHDETPTAKMTLDTYKDVPTADLIEKLAGPTDTAALGNLYQSLRISQQGDEWMLRWEFIYYLAKHPTDGTTQGVICRYNDSYAVNEVQLNLNPYTEYYTVSEKTFDDYFMNPIPAATETDRVAAHNAAMTGMNPITDPTKPLVYTYDKWNGDGVNENDTTIRECLEKYFKADWDDFVAKCNAYKTANAQGDQEDEETEEDTSGKPSLSITPVTRFAQTDPSLRYSYFCEYNYALSNDYGTDIKLAYVQDGTNRTSSSNSSHIYVVYSEHPQEVTANYPKAKFDDNGFLVTATGVRVCAIGDKAFAGVSKADVLTLPTQIGYIGDEAFQDSFIKEIYISSVEFIGNRAFQRCPTLSKVSIGTGTKVLGAECFESTPITDIELPYSISTIGYGAFANCSSLSTLNLNGISTACVVKEAAFYNCSGLTDIQMDSSNIRSLGTAAFAVNTGSNALNIVLPPNIASKYTYTENGSSKTVDGLGDHLFAGRTALASVVFPKEYGRSEASAVTIPDNMFHGCARLQYVEFPANWQTDPDACGFVSYGKKDADGRYILFADVITEGFYVRGPEKNAAGATALPRQSTWSAKSGRTDNNVVPYVYTDANGVEFYEVSDGYYLLSIDRESGLLTSCKFNPDADTDEWIKNGARLVIPAMVGDTKVTGIAANCFSDSKLNANVISLIIEDNSEIASIAAGAFRAGGGSGGNDWKKLEEVYIGNSITSIGDNAFRDCTNLIDVTFSSPLGGHEAFTIGEDAFKTESKQLTFHGDIVEGYAPFKWATDPGNIIQTQDAIRVCYKSLSPTYLTVMYNPITEMVTLLDYPKYNEISQILAQAHADEIKTGGFSGKTPYEDMKVAEWYARYGVGVTQYDTDRYEFIYAWLNIDSSAADAEAQKYALYASDLYGPWIDNIVTSNAANGWTYWVAETKKWAEAQGLASNDQKGNVLIDWLFEPITAYALEDAPQPYYEIYEYNVALIVDANDPYRAPTAEEQGLVYYTKNIEIPAGVQSIDVYGYVNNLTADGEKTTGQEVNTGNYRTYLRESWDSLSRDMYETEHAADDDGIKSVPGLFSGYYRDGAAAIQETRERGNDVIRSVTMYTVEYLPDYAFDSCEGLSYVILGEACADIGKAPFRGCHAMTTVGDNAYYTTVNGIIYSVNTDGSYTIEECLAARGNLVGQAVLNLSADADLANVSAIKPGAFEDCDYLTEVNFGSKDTAGLAVIPEDCFKNCDRLQTVVLPLTVNDVGKGAFVGANNLTGLTVYGKEVNISARAFDGEKDTWTTVRAYEDSAVVRYVKEWGDDYKLRYDDQHPLGELWQVTFYDYNYALIEDLKDQLGNDLENPQYVEDGTLATLPQNPANTDEWTFEKWVGSNNATLGAAIFEDTSFYARGYSNSGMVNGKYPVEFWDGIDGVQVGPTQYVEPGGDAIAPAHPVHAGYDADGFGGDYTNIQAPTTVVMKYKSNGSGGSGGSGNGSNGSTTINTTSTTSGSGSATGKYTVTVVNGSGSGTYDVGSTVIIAANTAPTGQVFQKWTTESNGVMLASVSMSATTFVMPANNVTVTANYVAGKGGSGNSGTTNKNNGNSGTTGNGNTRVDITKPGISNKDLATAHVNGSTDNFVIKITETDAATRAVADALTNKYGSLESILYYAMDISLYDATGTVKISDTTGITVDITIPIPDALVAYGGNNMAGAVINGNQLESLNESFTTINGVPCIRFTATHFSPYTIYVDTGNLTEGMLDTTPKTGDPIHPKWFLSIGLACLSVILFIKKDKAVKVKTA